MWDNESIAQYIVNEQERLERLRERFEREENRESEDDEEWETNYQ
jgi:hypothetical protein